MYSEVVSAEDLDIAARTVWGEARGEGFDGMVAVAHVIVNRAEKGGWRGDTLKRVCLKNWQFSCWNKSDPNRSKLEGLPKHTPGYREALNAVALALVADNDPTMGACHYHVAGLDPDWRDDSKITAKIHNHVFYAGID